MNGSGSRVYWVKNLRSVGNVDWRKSMIKCEVVFDGGEFDPDDVRDVIYGLNDDFMDDDVLESAIEYCMEN